jgi:hypothetical protein
MSAAIAGEGPAKSEAPRPTDDRGARKGEFLYSVRIQTVSGECITSVGHTGTLAVLSLERGLVPIWDSLPL